MPVGAALKDEMEPEDLREGSEKAGAEEEGRSGHGAVGGWGSESVRMVAGWDGESHPS